MSPTLLVFVGCFLGTLGVATFVWLMADGENRKESARQADYERRLRRRLARSAEDREYQRLHGIAADALNGPYDYARPLQARLNEAAADGMERCPVGTTNAYAPAVAAASLSLVEQGQAVSR